MLYNKYTKQIKIGAIITSKLELKEISKAWLAISVAFGIVIGGGFALSFGFFNAFLLSALTVGIGFLFHELSHKIVAQKYGCFAEFRAFDTMLILAVIMSFFGFVFAAPGAVFISGPVGRKRNGKISAAGPAANLILALIFLSIAINFGKSMITQYGFMINSWLALFNLLPIGNFDGRKVLAWDKRVYGAMIAIAVAFLFFMGVV